MAESAVLFMVVALFVRVGYILNDHHQVLNKPATCGDVGAQPYHRAILCVNEHRKRP